ncbi:9517_t:CDS:1, partial [Acaulospora colombiana]
EWETKKVHKERGAKDGQKNSKKQMFYCRRHPERPQGRRQRSLCPN